jgi:hypothetical protein
MILRLILFVLPTLFCQAVAQQTDIDMAKDIVGAFIEANAFDMQLNYSFYGEKMEGKPLEVMPYSFRKSGYNYYTSSPGIMDYIINTHTIYLVNHSEKYVLISNRKSMEGFQDMGQQQYFAAWDSLLQASSMQLKVTQSDSSLVIRYVYSTGLYDYSEFYFHPAQKKLQRAIYKYRELQNGYGYIVVDYLSYALNMTAGAIDFDYHPFLIRKGTVYVLQQPYQSYKLYDLQ